MKVIITGAYGETNFGDDLLMCVVGTYFQQEFPFFEISFLVSKNHYYLNKIQKMATFERVQLGKENYDLFLHGGGTQFFSFGTFENGIIKRWSFVLKLLFTNPELLLQIIKSKFKKITKQSPSFGRTAAIGIGLGPFQPSISAFPDLIKYLKSMSFVGVRDDISLSYCEEIGIDNAVFGADMCFSDYFDIREYLDGSSKRDKDKRKKIGVIVRDWSHDEKGAAYRDSLVKVSEKIKSFDFVYLLFSMEKDRKWLKYLNDRNIPHIYWNPEESTLHDFFSKINSFDGIITSRYHGAVFATLLDKPTIAINIEPKLEILTTQIPDMLSWDFPFIEYDLEAKIAKMFMGHNYKKSLDDLRYKSNQMFSRFSGFLVKIAK